MSETTLHRESADVIDAWLSAMNEHNAPALAQLYAEQANVLYGWGQLIRGREAISLHFLTFFQSFPDWAKKPYARLAWQDNCAVVEWRAEGTFEAEYDEFRPTGRSFHLRGCGVFRLTDGKIALHRRYFDRLDWYQQMGIARSNGQLLG